MYGLPKRSPSLILLAEIVLGLVTIGFVTLTVTTGHWGLVIVVVVSLFSICLLAPATGIVSSLVGTLRRTEVAWLLALSATLAIDTLTPDQVFSGALKAAQLTRFALLVVALLLILPNIKKWLQGERNGLWFGGLGRLFLIYVGIAFLSTLWSPGKIATSGKVFEMSVALLVIFITAAQPDAERRLRRLFYLTLSFSTVALTAILIGHSFAPARFGRYDPFKELFILNGGPIHISSNGISILGAIVALFALAYALERGTPLLMRALAICLVGYGCVFSYLAEGRTGIASFVLGALVLLLVRRPGLSLLSLPVTAFLIWHFYDKFWEFFRRGQPTELFMSATGRVSWWQAGLEKLWEQPLIGFGFGVGSRVVFADLGGRETTAGIHNGFLEVALGVGVIGFTIWFAVFVGWLWGIARSLVMGVDTPIYIVGVPMIFATTLTSGAGGWLSFELGLFLISMALLDRQNTFGLENEYKNRNGT